MGLPLRARNERLEGNIANLRSLVDAGSRRVVRDEMVIRRLSGGRRKHPLPSIGFRVGKVTVTGYLFADSFQSVVSLVVQCDCGREYSVDTNNFRNFRSSRCDACARGAGAAKRYWQYADAMSDDQHRTRLLNRLSAAIARCHNPGSRVFPHYGGRGIEVCKEWRDSRPAFLRYIQTLYGWDKPELEMDREDVNKGYEPGNIRFVTKSANMSNKRRVADLEEEIARLRSLLSRATQ